MIELTPQQVAARQFDYAQAQQEAQDAAFARIRTEEAAEQARLERAQQRTAWVEAGVRALGLAQVALRDANKQTVAFIYEQRAPAQDGLPRGLAEVAQAAVNRAAERVRALVAKDQETIAWCSRNGVGGEAANTKIVLARAELSTAAVEADREMQMALHDLGEAATQIAAARTVINQAPGLLSRIDAELERQRAIVAERVAAARTTLTRWGV